MKIYNSSTRKLEEFKVAEGGEVNMYLCGPTVYDLAHLGHGRSAVNFDLMRKYLSYKGYKVNFVSNYTDIDDKMIKRAAEKNISVEKLAGEIIPEYIADYSALGVDLDYIKPKATDYIDQMKEMINSLAAKDIAYKLEDGWYFDIKKFPEYGQLSGQNLDDLKAGARIDLVEGKRNPQDFVLWKFKKAGEPFWEDEYLGAGRPGWHIECSAMIRQVFNGKDIEIHGGGEDLKFPHHECEIAQSKSCFSGEFVKYWVHNAFVMVNNEKMSKSLNNFTTLRELFKTVDPQVLRFFYLQHHYRHPIDFHDAALEQAKNSLSRFWNFYETMKLCTEFAVENSDLRSYLDLCDEKINFHLSDNFETGKVLTELYGLISHISVGEKLKNISKNDWQMLMEFWKKWDVVLGFLIPKNEAILVNEALAKYDHSAVKKMIADFQGDRNDLKWLVASRLAARAEKNFSASDEIRDFLNSKDMLLEDSKNGTIVKFL
jgi:cysteinyl-tRNA synthetase